MLTQENAVDLNTVGRFPRKDGRGKNIYVSILSNTTIPAWPSFHWSPFVSCFVCIKPEVKFSHTCSHVEHYWK